MLSHRTFGKFSTTKTVTSRSKPCKKGGSKQVRCYDYVGDDMFLRVHEQLADWSKWELADIEPVIMAKYNVKERQECDVENCLNAQGILHLRKIEQEKQKNIEQKQRQIVEQKQLKEEAKRKEFALKKQAFNNGMRRNSKRHKTVDLPTGVFAVAIEYNEKGDQDAFEYEKRRQQVARDEEMNRHKAPQAQYDEEGSASTV